MTETPPDPADATREVPPIPAANNPPGPAPAPSPAPAATHSEPGLATEVRELGLGALESLTPGATATPAEITARVAAGIPASEHQRRWARLHAFNWRLALIRLLASGLAVTVTVLIVPGLKLAEWRWGTFLVVGLIFGLLNALVKPVLQFLVLRFIFSTYGLVVVLINTFLLWALDRLTDGLVDITGILAALLGGLGVGVFGLFFETILGANPPILDTRTIAAEGGTK